MQNSEVQKEKLEQLADRHNLTVAEYKRRCDINTAKNKGLSLAEYSKKRVADAAKKKGMSVKEYRNQCYENTARNKGFRNYKEYDKASKKARKLGMSREQYCALLLKDNDGYYILQEQERSTFNERHTGK